MARENVSMDAVAEHRESLFHVELPEGLAKLMLRTFGDIVHQHVQLSLFFANSCDQPCDLLGLQMVHHHGNGFAAARGDHIRRLLDGLWPPEIVFGGQTAHGTFFRRFRARAAASAVDSCARFAKRDRRAAPHAARSSRHERYAALQVRRLVRRVRGFHGSPRGRATLNNK